MSLSLGIFSDFHFLRPLWLFALIPAVVIFFLLLHRARTTTVWQNFIAPGLLQHMLDAPNGPKSNGHLFGLLLVWIVLTLALAGPVWQKKSLPVSEQTSALVILWDLSPSMLAEDIKPSRLMRSRLKLMDLLNNRREGLTALVVYSGEAHTVTPLTDDTRTIKSLLPGLSPEILPTRGSNIEMALESANQLLEAAGISRGKILVLTDGIDIDAIDSLEALHRQDKHRITFWGIGTQEGAPIPLNRGGFIRDNKGEIVIARLNEAIISDIAVKLRGLYVPFSASDNDIKMILSQNQRLSMQSETLEEREFDQWIEYGPLITLCLLPFAAFAFRRGWLVNILLVGSLTWLSPAPPAHAIEFQETWQNLWQNAEQKGKRALEQGDPETAAELFKSKDWRATAKYRAGDFEAAEKLYAEESSATNHFNRGNAFTQLGKYDEAIDAYNEALSLKPDFRQANDNLEIAKSLKKLPPEQQQNQQEDQQQNADDQDEPNEGSQNQQDSGHENSDSEQNPAEGQNPQSQGGQDSQQQNTQQNEDERGEQNQGEQSQREQDQDNQSQNEQRANEAQQRALEQAYGKNKDQQDQENEDDQTKSGEEASQMAKLEQQENNDEQQEENAQNTTARISPGRSRTTGIAKTVVA